MEVAQNQMMLKMLKMPKRTADRADGMVYYNDKYKHVMQQMLLCLPVMAVFLCEQCGQTFISMPLRVLVQGRQRMHT